MHPPFYVVDHKVGPRDPAPYLDRAITKRATPEALSLTLPDPHAIADEPTAPAPEAQGGKGHWLSRFWRMPTRTAAHA
jgi:hypothetical protein